MHSGFKKNMPDDDVPESRPKSRERSSLIIDNELFVGGGIMPARVSDWFEIVKDKEVKAVAGKKGLINPVSCSHIIEKPSFSEFLDGREIVFTTGVALDEPGELFEIAKDSFKAGSSAIVVNIGPYIKEVPNELLVFCDKNAFPLFTVPWHIHIEELLQAVYKISSDDRSSDPELETIFENAIKYPDRRELYEYKIEGKGYSRNWKYCVCMVHPTGAGLSDFITAGKLSEKISKESEENGDFSFSYTEGPDCIVIFANISSKEAEERIRDYLKEYDSFEYVFSVGRSTKSIRCLRKSYLLAQKILTMKIAGQLPKRIAGYDELGLYKIILGLENQDILNQIHEEYLKPLIEYDNACGTDYVTFINTYLKCDGRIKEISEKMFIHKNTVHYKIHRIEEILDCDLSRLDTKIYLMIATMNYMRQKTLGEESNE